MKIQRIQLNNYRCFENIEIDFHDSLTVLVGNNGAGKTAVLEGITVALGTLFTGLDGLSGISINKKGCPAEGVSNGRIRGCSGAVSGGYYSRRRCGW